MIKLIIGKEGSGKTRQLIQEANDAVKSTKGHIVYIDIDNSSMFQIDYKIRFMGLRDYQIENEQEFYGCLCGVIASNYDVESIYIDGLVKITNKSLDEMENFFRKVDSLEIRYNVNFIFALSVDEVEELPEFLKKYMISEVE